MNGTAPNATVESNLIFDGARLGIGTATPQVELQVVYTDTHTSGDLNLANSAIDIYNNSSADVIGKGSTLTFSDNYLGTNKTTRAAIKGGTDTAGNTADGFLAFYTDTSGANSMQEHMRIDNDGEVLIGTTTPTGAKLLVDHNNTKMLELKRSGNTKARFLADSNHGQLDLYNSATVNTIRLLASGNSYLNGGNVGIGITSPTEILHLSSDDTNLWTRIDNTNWVGGEFSGLWFRHGTQDYFSTQIKSYVEGGSSEVSLKFLTSINSATNQAMTIRGDGDVGIGTDSPGAKLEIESSSEPGIRLRETGGANYYDLKTNGSIAWFGDRANNEKNLVVTAGGGAEIRTNGDLVAVKVENQAPAGSLYVKSTTGNVGIGTTSPSSKLHVSSATSTSLTTVGVQTESGVIGNLAGIGFATSGTAGKYKSAIGHITTNNSQGVGAMVFCVDGVLDTNPVEIGDEKMRISSAGNVGIGTTSPSGLLHVSSGTSGDAVVIIESDTDNNNENDNPQLQFKQDGGATNAKIGLTGDGGGTHYAGSLINSAYFGNDESAALQLYTNATARLTIEPGGDVGIGTTNPATKLDVRGDITITNANGANPTDAGSLYFTEAAGVWGSTQYGFRINQQGTSNYLNFQSANTTTVRDILTLARDTGNVGIGNTSPSYKLEVTGNAKVSSNFYIGNVDAVTTATEVLVRQSDRVRGITPANLIDSISAPVTPGSITSTIVGQTIEIEFDESTTSNIDYYQVWSSDDGGGYGIIAQIPPTDFSATMTVVDTSFSTGGTMSYRVYAVKSGVYSSPGTTSKTYTVGTLDVTDMTVINLNTAYYIQYEKPASRFIDHIEIYMDSQTTQGALNRSNASIIYSGQNTSFMKSVGVSNNFHQFWVEVVTT